MNKTERAKASSDFNGQLQLHITTELHAALTKRAALEGVSVDELAVTYLARAVGRPDPQRKASAAVERAMVKRQTAEMRVLNPTSAGVVVVKPAVKKGKKRS